MFRSAKVFNSDLSNWDVSNVVSMDCMFLDAVSFKQKLCGAAWVHSKASQNTMFEGSPGSISPTKCTARHASRQPIFARALVSRTPISTSVSTAFVLTIADTLACPKCGTFEKSRKVSCCAPGGAWFTNCGGSSNRNADHKWFEGVEACKRKFKTIYM